MPSDAAFKGLITGTSIGLNESRAKAQRREEKTFFYSRKERKRRKERNNEKI